MEDPELRDSPPADPRSAEAISWLFLGVLAGAVVIGLFLLLRIG